MRRGVFLSYFLRFWGILVIIPIYLCWASELCQKMKNATNLRMLRCDAWYGEFYLQVRYMQHICVMVFFSEIAIQFDSLNKCNPHHICREIIIKVLFPWIDLACDHLEHYFQFLGSPGYSVFWPSTRTRMYFSIFLSLPIHYRLYKYF